MKKFVSKAGKGGTLKGSWQATERVRKKRREAKELHVARIGALERGKRHYLGTENRGGREEGRGFPGGRSVCRGLSS